MRSFIMRLGAILTGALLTLGLFSAPAHADQVTVTGTLTSASTGEPVAGCLSIYDLAFTYLGSACTNDAGAWSADVWGGESGVRLDAYPSDGLHLSGWVGGTSFDDATVFPVAEPVAATVVLGGVLEGTMLTPAGEPLINSMIEFRRTDWSGYGSAYTDFDGAWRALVAPGDYLVSFGDPNEPQWVEGKDAYEEATTFAVAGGATVRVNDRLLPKSSFTGTLTSAVTGQPVQACIDVLQVAPGEANGGSVAYACSDEQGRYSVDVYPGTFKLRFWSQEGDWALQFNGGHARVEDAPAITLERHQVEQVNAALAPGASISGVAVDARTGRPIEGICVGAAFGNAGPWLALRDMPCTGADGRWTLQGMPAGSFALYFEHTQQHYGATWAYKSSSQAGADLVRVAEGGSVTTRKVKLLPGGSISGRITDANGDPVEGVVVVATGTTLPWGDPDWRTSARTDADGRYAVKGLSAGAYTPLVTCFWPVPCDFAREWSGNSPTLEGAAPVIVRDTKATRFDASLEKAPVLHGRVVHRDGTPAFGGYLTLTAWDSAGGLLAYVSGFNAADLTVASLVEGDVKVQLQDQMTGEEIWYDGATSQDAATPIAVRNGEVTEFVFTIPNSMGVSPY